LIDNVLQPHEAAEFLYLTGGNSRSEPADLPLDLIGILRSLDLALRALRSLSA
jgi:hypothetical protein